MQRRPVFRPSRGVLAILALAFLAVLAGVPAAWRATSDLLSTGAGGAPAHVVPASVATVFAAPLEGERETLSLSSPVADDGYEERQETEQVANLPSSAALSWVEEVVSFDVPTPPGASDAEADEAFCAARIERLWGRLHTFVSPPLLAALRRQRERHLRVLRGDPEPGQKYLVWSLSGGVGNRFLSLASTFMAALVSGRVLLMKDWFTPLPPGHVRQVPVILASARTTEYRLEDLSTLFDVGSDGRGRRPNNTRLLCPLMPMMALSDFRDRYPGEFEPRGAGGGKAREDHVKVDIGARHDKKLERWERFFCADLAAPSVSGSGSSDEGKKGARGNVSFFPEKFVYVWTNQYYLPALYANPHHAAQMATYFPGGNPYSVLMRLLVLPSRAVVRRVRSFFASNPALRPRRFVGAHVRAFKEHVMTEMAHSFDHCMADAAAKGVKAAAKAAKEKRRQLGEADARDDTGPLPFNASHAVHGAPFFLASMHQPVRSYFVGKYGKQHVHVLAPPSHHQVTSDVSHDQEALTDMLLLSLAGPLFVSPGSTFSMFVAAYGDRVPIKVAGGRSCEAQQRGRQEPCFGAWFQRDHIARRAPSTFRCKLRPLPDGLVNC